MRALLIQPTDIRWFWGWSPPPVGLLSLAGSAPGTIVRDCAQEGSDELAVLEEVQPDILGVTAFTSTRHSALHLLEAAHDRGIRTVLGGPHVASAAVARQVAAEYPFVDHIVRGDGERTWQAIVAGEPVPRIALDYLPDLDILAPPNWSAVDVMSYPARDDGIVDGVDLATTPRVSVVFSRGCPGRCHFCNAWRRPFRQHSPGWIERSLEPLAALGVRHLCIDDDCWATDEATAIEICDVLHDLGFVWQAETRADLMTAALCDAMYDAGCYQVCVGLEHGSARMLELIGKGLDLDAVLATRRYCGDAGIRFAALCMDGYPGETEQDREEHLRFLHVLAPDSFSAFGATIILPGTDLWRDAVAAGQVTDDIWLGPGRHLIATDSGPRMTGA